MSDAKPTSAFPPKPRNQDYAFAAALFVLTLVVFWPSIRWLTTQTFAHEQLKQSFFLVVLAGGWIAWEKRSALRFSPQLGRSVLLSLCASYALAAAAILLKHPLFVLGGLVAAVAAFVNFLFGTLAFRRTLPLLAVFSLLLLSVLLFPILDWPLRQMAGIEAARLLKFFGFASQLSVLQTPHVALRLLVDGRQFEVATECNGFGLITSSFLLGTLLLLFRKAPLWRHVLTLPFCALIAFVFNFLRITAIVLLAPHFPGHYLAMHEIVGIIALYSGLGLVWFLTGRNPGTAKKHGSGS